MAITLKQSGFASSGVTRITAEPSGTTGSIIYVDSVTGSDSNTGLLEHLPKASVFGASGAYSVATTAVGDIIAVASGHTETISSAQTWDKSDIILIGKGTGTSRPRFTSAVAGAAVTFGGSGDYSVFDNLYFPASTAATTSRVTWGANAEQIVLRNCHFDCGANDTADTVLISGASHGSMLDSCSFTATATGAARGFLCSGAPSAMKLWNLTFSGGSVGWAGNAGAITGAAVGYEVLGLTLSGYSKFKITNASAKGRYHGVTTDESSEWVPVT